VDVYGWTVSTLLTALSSLRLVCFDTLVLCAERQHCGVEKASNGTERVIRAKRQKIICYMKKDYIQHRPGFTDRA